MSGVLKPKCIVIAQPQRPELKHLSKLPNSVEIVKISKSFADVGDEELRDVECMLVGAGPTGGTGIDAQEVFTRLPSLKWIHSTMAGLDFLMFDALLEAEGITVTNSKGVYSRSLAEYALFAAKYFALDAPRLLSQKADKTWEKYPVGELAGKTLSVIGYGDIGQATGKLAKAYGMNVLACRRNPKLSEDDPILSKMYPVSEINAMVAESDYVVVSTPLTPGTKHIVNAEVLSSMKPSGVLINIGRGPCVDEAALVAALESKAIKGAGLDVFETEPLPQSSKLWTFPNVLISPHNADQVEGWLDNSINLFVANMERYLAGGTDNLVNVVDVRRGY